MSDEWYGDTDPNNLPDGESGGAAGGAAGASGAGPVEIAPGLMAGDFVNGQGVLGINRTAAPDGSATAPGSPAPDWGPNGPVDPYDAYRWAQRLGDQGIAYTMKDGKIYVYTQPDAKLGSRAVDTIETFPMDTSPEGMNKVDDWSRLPGQNLHHPVYQNLNDYKKAIDYLSGYADPNHTLQAAQSGVPVVMIPGTADRFEAGVNEYIRHLLEPAANPGRIYWDPRMGLEIPNSGRQSPALQLFHEFGHAQHYFNAPIDRPLYDASLGPADFFSAARTKLNNGYDNAEEQADITRIETPAAKVLGEPIRTDHHSPTIPAWSPTSHDRK